LRSGGLDFLISFELRWFALGGFACLIPWMDGRKEREGVIVVAVEERQ
jgi:hypothetical protein